MNQQAQQRPSIQIFTPASRIVSGNVQRPNANDMHGRPRDKPQYFFAIAFPKNHPDAGPMFQAMHDFAAQQYAYHQDVLRRIGMLWTHGPKGIGFAYKFEDGDVPHPQKGIREGYAGCWVFKFTSTFPIRCCNAHNQPIAPETVLTGFLVDVCFNVQANGKTDHTAGLYLNPVFVRLLSAAQPIVGGPQASQVFQNRAAPTNELGNFRSAMAPASGTPGAGGYGGVPGGAGGMAPPAGQGGGGYGAAPQHAPGYQHSHTPPAPQSQHHTPGGQAGMGQAHGHGVSYQGTPGAGMTHVANQTFHQGVGGQVGNGGHSTHAHAGQMPPAGSAPMSMANHGGSVPSAGTTGHAEGGQGAGNPTHQMPSLPGSPHASSAMSAGTSSNTGESGHASSPGATTGTYPSSPEGNGHPHAAGPAVPDGASAAPVHSTGPGQGSQIASPSNPQSYQPHPGFVHGGGQAA